MWRHLTAWGVVAAVLVGLIPLSLTVVSTPAAGLVGRGPILIDGNAAFTPANGVTGGRGSAKDPFVVEGWDISAAGGDAVTIRNTDAYFDLRNVSVHSGGQTYAGVRLDQVRNGRIEGASFSDCGPALAINSTSDLSVVGNSFTANYAAAWVSSSTGLIFTRNTFRSGGGLEFSDSMRVDFTANAATGDYFFVATSPFGTGSQYNVSENTVSEIHTSTFDLRGIDGVVVEGNRLSSGGPGVVIDSSTNVSIYQNTISSAGGAGIAVGGSRHVLVDGNTISNVVQGQGISIAVSSDVVVRNNDLTNNEYGISLQANANLTANWNRLNGSGFWIDAYTVDEYRSLDVTNNTVNGLPFAAYRGCHDLTFDRAAVAQLFLVDCRHVSIRNETFKDLETGVTLINVEDTTVDSSVFENSSSQASLRVAWGSNVTIERSNVTRTRFGDGVWARYTRNLTVIGNTIRDNYIGMVVWNTTNATIFHNNFIHNPDVQAVDSGTVGTRWDDGYPDGGNYWSLYWGQDLCSGPLQDQCGSPDGIGDVPLSLESHVVDRYPLIRPYGLAAIPPVARIDAPQVHFTVTQVVTFDGGASYDLDGTVVAYAWDFGDGTSASGSYVTHAWSSGGTYNVTLTVRDNSGETNSTSVQVSVEIPVPGAYFDVKPADPLYVTQAVTFDGSGSSSNWGGIVSWVWDFGDGGAGSATVVSHQYSAAGTYSVRLTVRNSFGASASMERSVTVLPIPDIPLRTYQNHAGFRVPIPSAWSLSEDETFQDVTFAAVLRGPVHEGFTTNVIIDTGSDNTVRENNAYLASIVDSLLKSAQESSPGSYLSESPTYRSIAAHAGVVFAITDPAPPPIVQRFAIVVSDPHDRFWFVILSAHADYAFLYRAMFDAMVDGFEITIQPPVGSALLWASVAVVVGAVATVVLVVILRRRARPATFPVGGSVYPTTPQQWEGSRYCGMCGAPAVANGRFCGACGAALTPPRLDAAPPPGEPPHGRE